MPPAPRPQDDEQRLAVLERYGLLDTVPERQYDDLTALAAHVTGSPIAVISLVDRDRQWFKSVHGLDACETDRDAAFCGYTILADEPLIVPDATADPRFADNPLVTGPPHIRAYAGVPLFVPEGQPLGTLCVIDTQPRAFTETQVEQLQRLAHQVTSQMVSQVRLRELRDARDEKADAVRAIRKQQLTLSLQTEKAEVAADEACAAHERLDKIATQLPGVVYQYLLRPDGTACFPYASEGIRDIYDVTPQQVEDDASVVIDRLHPDDLDRVIRSITDSAERLSPWRCEYRYRKDDGDYRWLYGQSVPQRTDDGGTLWHGFITNVTVSRKTEQRLQLALDSAKLGLWDWDIRSGEVYYDNRWFTMLGYKADAFPGRIETWEELVHPSDIIQAQTMLQMHFADPAVPYRIELRYRTAEGKWKWIDSVGQVTERGPDGQPWRMTGVQVDVDERHRVYEQLIELRHDAEKASASKSAFLANMSHEIRTPMTAILGYADLLTQLDLDPADRFVHAETIKRNGEHLLAIINDILDLSRIESGKMNIESMPVDLSQFIAHTAELMGGPAKRKDLAFSVEVEDDLPAGVKTDPTRLRQVLLNLVGNAVKFTEQGGVTLRIARQGDYGLRFAVTDTGIGIKPEKIDTLFDTFTQADESHSRRFGGSGLGLAISQRLAFMLGGRIEVDSTVNEGSTFAVVFDEIETVTVESKPPCHQDEPDADRGAALVGRRVLLAEDSPDSQRLIAFHLKRAGAEVVAVDNGKAAVDAAEQAVKDGHPFDVILMDVQMPKLDGNAATWRLRRTGYNRPILTLSAHAMAGDRDKALTNGSDGYLTKPIDAEALIRACATAQRRVVPEAA